MNIAQQLVQADAETVCRPRPRPLPGGVRLCTIRTIRTIGSSKSETVRRPTGHSASIAADPVNFRRPTRRIRFPSPSSARCGPRLSSGPG